MAQWSGSDSGILRKTQAIENHDELLVFGYACKLFRDDEKALYIDQGKHLIPWMSDDKLKIDRYDCRGALSDLSKYEASREGFDVMRWLGLNDKERQLEELCDKERYYSLKINEEEEEMYKEEEQKRSKMNAIQYSYDVPQNPEMETEGIPTVEQAEEEYVPPPILDVPVDIAIPKTVKENARIEKTAKFVCRQGPQMEILIKAKQGDNPHFSFLNQNDILYKFYRHVLSAFKSGRYHGYDPESLNKTDAAGETDHPDSGSHYLHPSLLSTNSQHGDSTATQTVQVPQIPFKASVNCAYSQLVNRIQGNQVDPNAQEAKKTGTQTAAEQFFGQLTYEQQQFYQYYYMQQYYEYYKQMAMYQQDGGGSSDQFTPPSDFRNLDPSVQTYIHQLVYAQYMQHQQQQQQQQQQQVDNNSYAQIVSNVNRDGNAYSPNLPQLPTNLPQSANNVNGQNSPSLVVNEAVAKHENGTAKKEDVINKPLLSLATAYGSASESESENSDGSEDTEDSIGVKEKQSTEDKTEVYSSPTGELQLVIDKMADYVSKNGDQFEDIIRAKKDPRFEFLELNHEFNKYYKQKLRELKGETQNVGNEKINEVQKQEVKKEVKQVKEKETKDIKPVKKEKKIIAPVSFSIKKPKEEPPKEIKSALPIEESDEEETETSAQNSVNQTTNSLTSLLSKYSDNQRKETKEITTVNKVDIVLNTMKESAVKENNNRKDIKDGETQVKTNGILDGDDPLLEIIELTGESSTDKKDSKRAEDKIKDKLALAAREKLAAITKDKALQLERKRRAAAFLKQKLSETTTLINTIDLVSDKSKSPPSRRDSIEIIEDSSINERVIDTRIIDTINLDRSSSNERADSDKTSNSRERGRSCSIDVKSKSRRKKEKRSRRRSRSQSRSREKEKRRRRRSSTTDEEEGEYKKHTERKERKKSHKRKHSKHRSKSKKKSKKKSRRSRSSSSHDSDTS